MDQAVLSDFLTTKTRTKENTQQKHPVCAASTQTAGAFQGYGRPSRGGCGVVGGRRYFACFVNCEKLKYLMQLFRAICA